MPRTAQTTMDWDQAWYHHPRTKALRRHAGERWPVYLVAYLALVAEVWRAESPDVTLDDAWEDGIPCELEEAQAALAAVGMVTPEGRLPDATYQDRVEPAVVRKQAARAKGKAMADVRWGDAGRNAASNAQSNAVGNARPSVRPTVYGSNAARNADSIGGPPKPISELMPGLLPIITGEPDP